MHCGQTLEAWESGVVKIGICVVGWLGVAGRWGWGWVLVVGRLVWGVGLGGKGWYSVPERDSFSCARFPLLFWMIGHAEIRKGGDFGWCFVRVGWMGREVVKLGCLGLLSCLLWVRRGNIKRANLVLVRNGGL